MKITAKVLLNKAPVDWEKTVDRLNTRQREDLRRELEGIAERAGMLAGYLDERHGYSCGDRGHRKAVKRANRNGKVIWTKAFGYNAFVELTV